MVGPNYRDFDVRKFMSLIVQMFTFENSCHPIAQIIQFENSCHSLRTVLRVSSYSVGSTASGADAILYDATFLSDLMCRVRGYVPDSVARDDDCDIFAKKMLLFPFHR